MQNTGFFISFLPAQLVKIQLKSTLNNVYAVTLVAESRHVNEQMTEEWGF
jgi:hypothetical protein